MQNLQPLLNKAKKSKLHLKKLNFMLSYAIPFNRRHNIKIASLEDNMVACSIPYSKKNFNHIRGIHACAITTVGEFASGLALMMHFNSSHYRIIMSKMEVEYFYQARQDIIARSQCVESAVSQVKDQLNTAESVIHVMQSEVRDKENNHIATVTMQWQIKPWAKVKVDLK
jgi:acyl-coenzyme A thioesterase PaaI-like protein